MTMHSRKANTHELGRMAGHCPPITPSLVQEQAADQPIGPPGHNEEERLDEALKETFPTSDPISIHIESEAE